jgi:sulfite reductase beta subunit-like hemoprotein
MWVGGGLGAQPILSQKLLDYIVVSEVPAACAAVVETHRLYGNRDSRTTARLKFVMKKWGVEKYRGIWQEHFQDYLEKLGRPKFDLKAEPSEIWAPSLGAPYYKQKKKGMYGVECMVPIGDARAEDMLSLVGFCRRNNCLVRLTQGQNLHVQYVPESAASELKTLTEYYGWAMQDTEKSPNVIACVGLDECGKAVFYTKNVAKQISQDLINDSRGIPKGLTIHFSGCPNNCGQNSSGAIGFMGATRPGAWQKEGVYSLYLGGTLEGAGAIGKMAATGLKPDKLDNVIHELVNAYHADRKIESDSDRSVGEDFSTWARTLDRARLVNLIKVAESKS